MESEMLQTCPYDETHRIRPKAMSRHLHKCALNHPFSTKICCPFNVTHIMEPENLKQHLEECRSNKIADQFIFESETITGIIPLDMVDNQKIKLSFEDWDQVNYANSFDPIKATENRKVLRLVSGKSRSERRKLRQTERLRWKNLDNEDCTSNGLKFKMLTETAIRAQKSKGIHLHDLLFPENIGIHKLSIHDTDAYLEAIQFHKLSICGKDVYIDCIGFKHLKI